MARRYIPPIDPGLATGQAVVGGVNSFMQAFQGAQRDRRQMAMQEAQLASQRELQALQIQKLKEEIGPQEIQLQQIGLALEGMEAGVPGMDSIFKKKSSEIIDSVQTPAQAQLVSNAMRQFQGSQGGGGQGGGIGASAMTGQGPSVTSSVAQREPITLNRASRDVLEKMISARSTANLAGARIQSQERIAELNAEERKALAKLNQEGKLDLAQLMANKDVYLQKLRNAGLLKATQARIKSSQTATQANNIRNKISENISKITGASQSGLVKIPLRGEAKEKLQSEVDSLKTQYKKLTGQDYDVQASPSPATSALPPPVTPAQKTAPKKAESAVPTLPPAAQAAVDAAPEGKTFTLQGKRYIKQGGKLVGL